MLVSSYYNIIIKIINNNNTFSLVGILIDQNDPLVYLRNFIIVI